jgi:hypothetical protein
MAGEAVEGRRAGKQTRARSWFRASGLAAGFNRVVFALRNHSAHAACAIIGTGSMLSPMVNAPRQPNVEAWVPGSNESA